MTQETQGHPGFSPAALPATSRDWVNAAGIAVAVGVAYFLAARLSLHLLTKPDGVAVFWPAAGIAAGVLISLGAGARLPVIVGAMGATVVANLLGDRNLWSALVFALCNAGEAVLVAWLVGRFFGSAFDLDSVRRVLGLLAATVIGTTVSGIGGTAGFVFFHGSGALLLTTWYHWFASDGLGIITVAPVLIGLAALSRAPAPRHEVMEGIVALVLLTAVSVLNIFLPRQPWAVVVSIAAIFPLFLWVAARCSAIFAAIAAFIVALTIVWSTTFGIGILGRSNLSVGDMISVAQASILAVSLCALVLAALFAERRAHETHLARSNAMLERERDNRLMNLEAMAASIAHEVRQPLTAIANNGGAALRFLNHAPPNLDEARSSLNRIVSDSHRASEVFDSIRALFGRDNLPKQTIDMNEVARGSLRILADELNDHGIVVRADLAPALPPVAGHRSQLQEVVINLMRNAIEAMATAKSYRRVLQIRTEHDDGAIALAVEDSGPGIDQDKMNEIFDAFVSTKPNGMGLGLAICRMIVDHHDGHLSVAPAEPHGAIFRIGLPLTPPPH
jgi:signal transduction histidine kinase